MSEDPTTYMGAPGGAAPNGWSDAPPVKRNGTRGLLPGSWLGLPVRLSYIDAHGKGVETSGTLLDYCGTGPIFNLAGGRVLLAWDRIATVELVSD